MCLVWAILATLTGLAISISVVYLMTFQEEAKIGDMDDEKEKRSANLQLKVVRVFYTLLFMFIMWALVNMLSYADQTSRYKEERTGATLSDIVSSFGLESGKEYPVVIGDRTTVDSGQVSYSGMFYVKGAGEWTSSTSILVAFEGNNGSYVLEIPISKITFDIQRDVTEAFLSVDVPDTKQPEEVAYWQHSYTCSDNTWAYGWVQKNCSPNPFQLVISDDVSRQGLSPVIADAFKESAGAKITLSPSMYNDILGSR